jgi:battenin
LISIYLFDTPQLFLCQGIIAFCNVAPALAAKIGWPYLLKGRVRYTRRIVGCCFLSVLGMIVSYPSAIMATPQFPDLLQVVAAYEALSMRLLGIIILRAW